MDNAVNEPYGKSRQDGGKGQGEGENDDDGIVHGNSGDFGDLVRRESVDEQVSRHEGQPSGDAKTKEDGRHVEGEQDSGHLVLSGPVPLGRVGAVGLQEGARSILGPGGHYGVDLHVRDSS